MLARCILGYIIKAQCVSKNTHPYLPVNINDCRSSASINLSQFSCDFWLTALKTACCQGRCGTVTHPVISMVKVKVNFTLEQATKAHRGSRGIALSFL